MKIATALLIVASMLVIAEPTFAQNQSKTATLRDLNGKVLVNKGDGLISGKEGAPLMDGDRIVTLDKSSAEIVFDDGCTITLKENRVLVIDMDLGCKALPLASNGAAVATGGFNAAAAALIGAGVVGAGIAIGGGNNNNDNRPISAQ
jgi:hypothetical protein